MIAARVGPDVVVRFRDRMDVSPSMDGRLFEKWFLAKVRTATTTYTLRGDEENPSEWPMVEVSFFDPRAMVVAVAQNPRMWFVPERWDHAGYDIIFLDSYTRVEWNEQLESTAPVTRTRACFLQLTRGRNHDSIAEPFYDMLNRLSIKVSKLEVWFVVPDERLGEFKHTRNRRWFETEVVLKSFLEGLDVVDANQVGHVATSTNIGSRRGQGQGGGHRRNGNYDSTIDERQRAQDGRSDENRRYGRIARLGRSVMKLCPSNRDRPYYYLPLTVECEIHVAGVSYPLANP